MRPESQYQLLVALGAAEDADIGDGGGGKQAAGDVEGGSPRGTSGRSVVGRDGRLQLYLDGFEHLAVGVEQPVEGLEVDGRVRAVQDFGIAVVAVAATRLVAVVDVAGRLLQVPHQPAALKDLGEQVGNLLTADVHAGELRHRIVAICRDHSAEEIGGLGGADLGNGGGIVARLVELVEEDALEGLGGTAVAGKKGGTGGFGQIHQHRHRPVDRGEVAAYYGSLLGAELSLDVGRH